MIAEIQALTVARAGEVVVLAFSDLAEVPNEVDRAALEDLAERDDVVLLDPDDAAYFGDAIKGAAEEARDGLAAPLGGAEQ